MTPFGAVTWTPPGAPQPQTDIYTADTKGFLIRYSKIGNGALGAPRLVASGWNHYTTFGIADSNHDGYPDLIERDNTTGNVVIFPNGPAGLASNPVAVGAAWGTYTPFGVADWNHDGHYDLIAVEQATNIMWMYPGNADLTGGNGPRVQIGAGWTSNFVPYGIVDFTGGGNEDILTRLTDTSELKLYPEDSTGYGGVPTTIGIGWNGYTFFGLTDYNSDGHPDIIARQDSTGALLLYPGAGSTSNALGDSTQIAKGW